MKNIIFFTIFAAIFIIVLSATMCGKSTTRVVQSNTHYEQDYDHDVDLPFDFRFHAVDVVEFTYLIGVYKLL